MKKSTVITLFLVILAIVVVPLFIKKGAEFGGSDDAASGLIEELKPGFEPWAEPLYEPPSGEIESLLFSCQALIGGLVVGYYIGVNAKKKTKEEASSRGKAASLGK